MDHRHGSLRGVRTYHIRTTWAEPHHKETQQQWATRLCAAYADQEQAMREWLDRPMGATTGHGREQRGQAPDNSEGPPQGAWREEPRDDPEQPQGANWGEWSQDRGWSRPWDSGWDNSAGAFDHADNHHSEPWRRRAAWSSDQTPNDPWHSRCGRGSRGAQDGAARDVPNAPWSSYANRQQYQEPREEQRPEENHQPWQAPAEHHARADPGHQAARRAPRWEEEWLARNSHTEMRYGD